MQELLSVLNSIMNDSTNNRRQQLQKLVERTVKENDSLKEENRILKEVKGSLKEENRMYKRGNKELNDEIIHLRKQLESQNNKLFKEVNVDEEIIRLNAIHNAEIRKKEKEIQVLKEELNL